MVMATLQKKWWMQLKKDFEEHFWVLQNKLKAGENFAFSRYSDGEMDIMQDKHLVLDGKSTRIDGQKAGMAYSEIDHKEYDPKRHGDFRERLMDAYRFKKENYFVGLSCPCCVGKQNSDWMKKERGGDDEHLTWANLLVNSNYPLFLGHMYPELQKKDIVIVCNENADLSEIPLSIKKEYRIGYNAMINNIGLVEEIGDWIKEGKIENHVFLFSASTLSNILIYELFKKYPNNTYIDIGTTLAPMMKLPIQRNYLRGYWLKTGNTEIYKTCVW